VTETDHPNVVKRIFPRSEGYRQTTCWITPPQGEHATRACKHLLPSSDENLLVYVLKICQITKLDSVHPLYEGSNPFVEMKLDSKDSQFADWDQVQRTSYKPLTVEPQWLPSERFLFYSNQNDATILSQIHFTV
jgi:hypothetical protein